MTNRVPELQAAQDEPRLHAFFASKGRMFDEPVKFIWRELDGKILGGWALTGYTGETVQVHIAGNRGWLNRELLRAVFTYCFEQLGAKVILAAVPGSNPRSLKIGRRLGFRELATIEEIDLHLFTMSRKQCRWLGETHG